MPTEKRNKFMEAVSVTPGWLRKFTALRDNPDKGRGRAPHKPLLILAGLDLLESGLLADGRVTFSPDLLVRFKNFWPIVAERRGNKDDKHGASKR